MNHPAPTSTNEHQRAPTSTNEHQRVLTSRNVLERERTRTNEQERKMRKVNAAQKFLRSESGNVESALVLVPLLVLVLSVLQIGMGVLSRNAASNRTQSAVVQSSLFNPDGQSALSMMPTFGITSGTGLTLSGGGTLYIGAQKNLLPSLTPLLPSGDSFTSVVVSLGEGS